MHIAMVIVDAIATMEKPTTNRNAEEIVAANDREDETGLSDMSRPLSELDRSHLPSAGRMSSCINPRLRPRRHFCATSSNT